MYITPIDCALEKAERNMLFSMAKDGDVFYDIGANEGMYSLEFASRFRKGKVYSFEPIHGPREKLAASIDADGFDNIIIWPCGLADKPGPALFYVSAKDSGATSMRPIDELRFGTVTTQTEDVTTIDNLVELGNAFPNLIKCDVEGAELLVFKGGRKTLEKHRPVIQTEMLRKWSARFGYHPNDIIKFFADLHYRCYVIRDQHLAPFSVMTEDTVETNFYFLPEKML